MLQSADEAARRRPDLRATSTRIAACVCAAAVLAVLVVAIRNGLFGVVPDTMAWRLVAFIALGGVLAWATTRLPPRLRHSPATGSALLAMALLAAYAGPAPVLAGLLLLAAALALTPRHAAPPVGPPVLVGLAFIVAVVGWALPFPLHGPRVYLLIAVALCALRWQRINTACRGAALEWQQIAVECGPWLPALVVVVGVAGLGLWLPSMNYDDNAAHLILPTQLLRDGWYHLDVSTQVWAVSPWANNVLGAVVALLAGEDARAAIGLLWLLLGVDGARRVALALGSNNRVALAAAMVFAATPLTGYFTTSMQVDAASAAVLFHLAALLLRSGRQLPSPLIAGALFGLLAGLKVPNVVYAAPALAWLASIALRQRRWRWLLHMVLVSAVLGGSSYAYALLVTGSPVFPLFNSVFHSPYLPAVDFVDTRWLTGVNWDTLWRLTFSTGQYGEVYAGAFGLFTLALLPAAMVLAARERPALAILAWFVGSGLVVFLQVQYLRYVFPAAAGISILGVVGLSRIMRERWWAMLLVVLSIANVALIGSTNWMLREDPWQQLLRDGPVSRGALEERFVPQKALLRQLISAEPDACVLVADPASPFAAMAGGRATVVTDSYDKRMANSYTWANQDPTGIRWRRVLAALGTTDVIVTDAPTPALQAALEASGYHPSARVGVAEAWSRAQQGGPGCDGFIRSRDEALRRLRPSGGTQ